MTLTTSANIFGSVGTFGYSYVGNTSRLSRMDRPNGTSTILSYENLQDPNSLHRLTGVQDISTASGANIAGFGYGYDSPGTQNGFLDNRTSQTRAYGSEAAQTVSYGYNPTSMLQGEGAAAGGASTPALSKSYAFDPMGNRTGYSDAVAKTQVTSTYNPLNQLTSTNSFNTSSGQAVASGSSAFGYDGDGNMALISSKDATGSVTSQTTYSYDDASRLIGIETPGSSKWQFVYDGMSRLRISRSWNWINGAWAPTSEKRRVYLGMDVVQERNANNLVTASYTRTGNIGGLLARSTSTGNVFYGYDGGGNVTSLTDSTGATVGTYTYDAWGNLLNSSGAQANDNPFRFSTKEQLAGYTFYGYRFYSPGLGRWINRDPIREVGSLNSYEFVNNNAVNAADSYGLLGFELQATIVGFLMGAVGSFAGQMLVAGWQHYHNGVPWSCFDFRQMLINAFMSGLAGAVQGFLLSEGKLVNSNTAAGIVGAITGGIGSIISQFEQGGVSGISGKQVAIDVGIGAATGAIAGPADFGQMPINAGSYPSVISNITAGYVVGSIATKVGAVATVAGSVGSSLTGGLPMKPCCAGNSSGGKSSL